MLFSALGFIKHEADSITKLETATTTTAAAASVLVPFFNLSVFATEAATAAVEGASTLETSIASHDFISDQNSNSNQKLNRIIYAESSYTEKKKESTQTTLGAVGGAEEALWAELEFDFPTATKALGKDKKVDVQRRQETKKVDIAAATKGGAGKAKVVDIGILVKLMRKWTSEKGVTFSDEGTYVSPFVESHRGGTVQYDRCREWAFTIVVNSKLCYAKVAGGSGRVKTDCTFRMNNEEELRTFKTWFNENVSLHMYLPKKREAMAVAGPGYSLRL